MKRIIYFIYNTIYKLYFVNKFKKELSKVKSDIYIFDIDNTIANTWPSFLLGYTDQKERLSSLAIFYNMRKHIMELKAMNKEIFFLTARPYTVYNLTYKWLESMDIIDDKNKLFLVSKPYEKIELLKKFPNKKIIFYDDFTYNHEKGEMKYYQSEINEVDVLSNVKYNDVEKINKIIEGKYE